MTMIYPETGWIKVVQYNDKHAPTIEKPSYQEWLCRYLRPKGMYYHSNEFFSHTFKNSNSKQMRN